MTSVSELDRIFGGDTEPDPRGLPSGYRDMRRGGDPNMVWDRRANWTPGSGPSGRWAYSPGQGGFQNYDVANRTGTDPAYAAQMSANYYSGANARRGSPGYQQGGQMPNRGQMPPPMPPGTNPVGQPEPYLLQGQGRPGYGGQGWAAQIRQGRPNGNGTVTSPDYSGYGNYNRGDQMVGNAWNPVTGGNMPVGQGRPGYGGQGRPGYGGNQGYLGGTPGWYGRGGGDQPNPGMPQQTQGISPQQNMMANAFAGYR